MSQSTLKSTLIELRIPDVLIDLINSYYMHRSITCYRTAMYWQKLFYLRNILSPRVQEILQFTGIA